MFYLSVELVRGLVYVFLRVWGKRGGGLCFAYTICMWVFALGRCSGRGAYLVGILFHSCRSPIRLAMVWLGALFPSRVGIREFVGKMCKLGIKFPEDVSEMHSG